MSKSEKIKQTVEMVQLVASNIQDIQKDIGDYDLSRMLKKVEAEVLDLQHNLNIVVRLLERE